MQVFITNTTNVWNILVTQKEKTHFPYNAVIGGKSGPLKPEKEALELFSYENTALLLQKQLYHRANLVTDEATTL